MREEYIKKVKKELAVSHRQTHEIIRDLNEAFDSAAEHGETEEQVINRLGTPKDFAENLEETIGFNRVPDRKKRKKLIGICCSCGIAVCCLIGALIAKSSAPPDHVIGQADAMTTITVKSLVPFHTFGVLLIIGFIFAVIAIVLLTGLIRKKR